MPTVRPTFLRIAESPGVIFLVALTMRLWVLWQLLPQKTWEYFYRYNEPSHIAWALASGFGYSAPWPNTPVAATAQQPPVYPILLAGIFKVAGIYSYTSLWIATGLNAAISAATAVLMLKIGQRMFGAWVGVLAAWVWSCWLFESASTVRLWESSLAAFLLAMGIFLLPDLAASLRPWRWLLFGR